MFRFYPEKIIHLPIGKHGSSTADYGNDNCTAIGTAVAGD
jgi:hypothetical protein